MASPTRDDCKTYLGADGIPLNDTDPLGDAISTGVAVDPNTLGGLYGDIRLDSTDQTYYTIFYKRMEQTSPGNLANARFSNRAGARLNTTAGNASVVSTNAADVGEIKVTGKVSGTWTSETLTLTGTTPVIGSQVWDINSVVRWESLDGVQLGLITCSVNSATCAVIWGTDNDPQDGFPSIATSFASYEMQFALCTAINTTLSSANRKTAPTGIGSFSSATRWSGEDFSIAVPGGDLGEDDYIGVCGRLIAYANIPAPTNGRFQFKHSLIGDSE
jgi:hypothetical protein